ncbi:transcriptional activator xlnR [Diaporthe amygdali]|uniref:transcriptional activator xlnR n=1 Tax=Phomopsis amygdali TaxID=1214568 RepID=UPI0022FF30CA|nr:transcriptional activator xlnR [Diaporthe amygdali]KAJ0123728.1 transcriptional activator xlnR [Diaporthe amygdali]
MDTETSPDRMEVEGEPDGDGDKRSLREFSSLPGEGDESREHARPRKRTRRACDKCSSSRTRCDGEYPCRRCEDYGYTCRYNREIKKRGRAPTTSLGNHAARSDSTGSTTPSAKVKRQSLGAISPSPPVASPETSLPPLHFPQSHERYRDGISLASVQPHRPSYDDGRPSISHMVIQPSAAPVQSPAYLSSPAYSNTNTQIQLSSLLEPSAESPVLKKTHESPPQMSAQAGRTSDAEPSVPSASVGYPSPANAGSPPQRAPSSRSRQSFSNCPPPLPHGRDSVSSTTNGREGSIPEGQRLHNSLYKAPSADCRYRCLDPVLPYLRDIIPASVACDLLDVYLTEPGSSLFRCGLRVESDQPQTGYDFSSTQPLLTAKNEPAGAIDDVLTFILLSIAVSGGDFKSDCFKWWSKAVRLAASLELNREDERCLATVSPCANPLCSCKREQEDFSLSSTEAREERRRVFWLLYCLDRHLALSFNRVLDIPDSYCEVYENIWENLDTIAPKDIPPRVIGASSIITGTGYFEYFLPLMSILGDIIEVHHRRFHPRLGMVDDTHAVAIIGDLLANCEASIEKLRQEIELVEYAAPMPTPGAGPSIKDLISGYSNLPPPTHGPPPPTTVPAPTAAATRAKDRSRLQLVTAYSTHILHVLHVLLHGKWDAISMLDDDDDWITSARFNNCASHAIAASQAVSQILKFDPELTFMPYLFGIYLLHGSFILLLFADRMPRVGPNQSVELACETIVRAHEVCVVTLSTEFQKNFRKVLRSTLYSVRGSSPTEWEEHKARRRALSLYRWTKGAKGLAL